MCFNNHHHNKRSGNDFLVNQNIFSVLKQFVRIAIKSQCLEFSVLDEIEQMDSNSLTPGPLLNYNT